MAFFAWTAGILGDGQGRIVEQLGQNPTSIAEERLAQADFDCFEIADPVLPPLRLD
jgi:hypothetical protein